MTITTYIEAEDCLFVAPIEFSVIESELKPDFRAELMEKGYPRVTLKNGEVHSYIPIEINGKAHRLISGSRPIVDEQSDDMHPEVKAGIEQV